VVSSYLQDTKNVRNINVVDSTSIKIVVSSTSHNQAGASATQRFSIDGKGCLVKLRPMQMTPEFLPDCAPGFLRPSKAPEVT
jgi:hypothetical protein